MTVYLIQHQQTGYIHTVFSSLTAADNWIWRYRAASGNDDYSVVVRHVYESAYDVGL